MKRRKFIKSTLMFSAAAFITPRVIASTNFNNAKKDSFKGFIVSDSHFGWVHKMQPPIEEQAAAVKNIMKKFPDLDIFLDTGDAHHNDHHNNGNPHKARKDWVDIIQGGCEQIPFYYVIGNHELRSNEDDDPEMRSNIMGSNTCRPYYSFDMQGIHFISFPQLIRAVYITEEAWDWLDLDLALNKDKTIVMLSHNNIIGTTTGNENGYRGVMDSDKMLAVFKKNPNIITWMHGHNHNFEIVNRDDMLFVSNGRIGGFDPSSGKYGIGGVYFEITKDKLIVKCYSAEKDMFLDSFDVSLSQTLDVKTTFDNKADFAYSYGVGGAVNGERIPAYHHHVGENTKSELFLTGCNSAVINDDHAMTKYTERKAYHGLDKILFAAKVNHGNAGFEYTNPGIRLKANDNWWTTLTMPSDNYDKYSYYRCPLGQKYKASIDLDVKGEKGKQRLWLRLHIYDINGRKLRIVQSDEIMLVEGRQQLDCLLEVPNLPEFDTIYSNPQSDNLVNIAVEASFTGMNTDVDIKYLKLEQEHSASNTVDAGVIIDTKNYQTSGVLAKGDIKKIELDKPLETRSINEISTSGNKRVTYLVRHSNMKWQVRNATATYLEKHIKIGKIRNHISDKLEIIISPLQKEIEPYLHRIRYAEKIKLVPYQSKNQSIKVTIENVFQNAEIDFYSTKKPKVVAGVTSWIYKDNIVTAKISKPTTVLVTF